MSCRASRSQCFRYAVPGFMTKTEPASSLTLKRVPLSRTASAQRDLQHEKIERRRGDLDLRPIFEKANARAAQARLPMNEVQLPSSHLEFMSRKNPAEKIASRCRHSSFASRASRAEGHRDAEFRAASSSPIRHRKPHRMVAIRGWASRVAARDRLSSLTEFCGFRIAAPGPLQSASFGLDEERRSMLKTGRDYLEGLRDGRTVYIGRERVADVTTHPAFRNAALSFAEFYDIKADPARRDQMSFAEDGETHSIYYLKARTKEDLAKRSNGAPHSGRGELRPARSLA